MLLVSLINNYHYYYYFTIPFIYLLTHLFLYLLSVLYCFTYIICHLYVFSYISYLLESFLNLSNYFFPDLLIYLFIYQLLWFSWFFIVALYDLGLFKVSLQVVSLHIIFYGSDKTMPPPTLTHYDPPAAKIFPPPPAATHYQPKYIHLHPPPPTTIQKISANTHHGLPAAKTFFIRNPFVRISSQCLTAT